MQSCSLDQPSPKQSFSFLLEHGRIQGGVDQTLRNQHKDGFSNTPKQTLVLHFAELIGFHLPSDNA
jgi:hypothetical protein